MSPIELAAVLAAVVLVASVVSVELGVTVALIELTLGVIAGNVFDLQSQEWLDFIAAFASIVLTFLAGMEVDTDYMRDRAKATIGLEHRPARSRPYPRSRVSSLEIRAAIVLTESDEPRPQARRGARASLRRVSHPPAHLCDAALRSRAQCEAGTGLARPALARLHLGDLRPLLSDDLPPDISILDGLPDPADHKATTPAVRSGEMQLGGGAI